MIIDIQPFHDMATINEAKKKLKNDYAKARKECKNGIDQVLLIFDKPTLLHYTKYMKDDKIKVSHSVKGLFFLKDNCCDCEYNESSEVDMVCYIPNSRKSKGYSLSLMDLKAVTIIEKTIKDYSKQWQSIADSMKQYHINPDVVKAIEDHLQGRTEYIKGFQNYLTKQNKPHTMSFADVLIRATGYPKYELGKTYPHKEWVKIEQDHIRNNAIEAMKSRATKSTYGDYLHYKTEILGKRDRSVSIQVYPDGHMLYTAASEFSGCGNGDYYIMYSPTMAFYCESD